jgi:hypothetical protein
MLPDLKTPLLWLVSIALIGALGVAAVERTMAAKAKQNLAEERLSRSQENDARNRAALRYAEQQIEKQAAHSARQTEIANALEAQTKLREAADARNTVLAARMRGTADQLAAALDRQERDRRAAAGGDSEYRPDPFVGLLAEAGSLLAEAGKLAGEGANIVGRRDAEVRALTDVIANDRALSAPDPAPAPAATDVDFSIVPATNVRLPMVR